MVGSQYFTFNQKESLKLIMIFVLFLRNHISAICTIYYKVGETRSVPKLVKIIIKSKINVIIIIFF